MISPEKWGSMKVSKHHYAMELARRDCNVYFIEPPDLNNRGIVVEECADDSRINIVSYRPIFRGKRYLPPFFYKALLKLQVNRLIKTIRQKPDTVWCFHGYLFYNLKWFKAAKNIFFAADQFFYPENPPEIDTADITVAISDTIFNRIKMKGKNVYRLNHGLQKPFVERAKFLLENKISLQVHERVVAGYTGNLMMEALDRNMMRMVIESNPGIKFIFWGSFDKADLNLGASYSTESLEFICFLKKQENVELRGVVGGQQLQEEMQEAHLFWMCWDLNKHTLWDGSNSHKILEYMSTGCPIVSHFVSSYADTALLYMMKTKSNESFRELFSETIQMIKSGEPPVKVEERLKWAIENAYDKQLERIESFICNSNRK